MNQLYTSYKDLNGSILDYRIKGLTKNRNKRKNILLIVADILIYWLTKFLILFVKRILFGF